MAGANTDPETGEVLVDMSAMDYLSGSYVDTNLYQYEGNYKDETEMTDEERGITTKNWYFKKVSSIKIVSSTNQNLLDNTFESAFDALKSLILSATLTIWGEYNNTYVPGKYIDLTVMTPDNKQHYSSGRYFILASDDSITSDGYTTTLKLLKNLDKSIEYNSIDIGRAAATSPGKYLNDINPYGESNSSNNSTNQQKKIIDNLADGTNEYKAYAKSQLSKYGWNENEFTYLEQLWQKESSWNPKATNPSSGAYGIPQALPAEKMGETSQGGGPDYLTNYKTQINWGLKYIATRYMTPYKAWDFQRKNNWY